MTEEQKDKNRAASRRHYARNKKKIIAKVRLWQSENPEKKRAATERHAQTREKRERFYREKNPEKAKAHDAVANAVKREKLKPANACACADCGKQAAHYHHEDYSQKLEVEALCVKCHRVRHKK